MLLADHRFVFAKGVAMIKNCVENVRSKTPLIHNITNYVTVNDVANVFIA